MERLLSYFDRKITRRMRLTFLITFFSGLFVHLYIITNGFVNRDTMYNYYSTQNMSGSGRFTLTYLAGISSYFDIHLVNGLLSIIYLALSVTLLVELLDIHSKLAISFTAILYTAFPTVAGILTYMFTADGYHLASLLAVLSIFFIKKINNPYISILIASLAIYVSIGSYQANLTLVLTLLLILFVVDMLDKNKFPLSFYVKSFASVFIGLGIYVIHFKWYEKYSEKGLTSYKGINESGNINVEHITRSLETSSNEMKSFLFNSGDFVNTFEKFNLVYFILLFIMFVIYIIVQKVNLINVIGLIVVIVLTPYITHIIFFISPGVEYHILMKQNLALLFIVGVVILDRFIKHTSITITSLNIVFTFSIFLVAFNNVIITNIYYEQFEDVNKHNEALMTQIAYDIRHLDGYNGDLKIITQGTLRNHLSVRDRYKKVPHNVGISSTIAYDTNTFVYYMNNEIGLKNEVKRNIREFIEKHKEEINSLNTWPNQSSMKIIEDTIVINFE
ncbi:glucosyltransferase domain-containing protein [Lysinibacillus sp. BW-2-10]|uniref:glucosyltransferase domain-containing protein n=1 Tax=Lysinibacillus sp. BW-2-10 TaxID=2590030 RepID=UPI00117BE7D5|nr:glucosyltransferase domain-containing protein [Lysinibacillus sp. BW-2-10]TSI03315.1 hypothetical protein FJQ64_17590 [Lysinibacillus sp. BW-2-10]